MKLIFSLIVTMAFANHAAAQGYNNEWIDYSKTYYKFQVPKDGLYRINLNTLQAAGIGSTPAQNFQLWRNGQQQPIYTSVASGPLGSDDYIEFWGKANDGNPDNQLYNFATHQLSRKWSLYNDTASYFLTVNTNVSQNLRLINVVNNVAGNSLPATQNFMHTVGFYPRDNVHPGFAAVVGEYLHVSAYDNGEGWSTGDIFSNAPFNTPAFTNLFPDVSSTVTPTFSFAAAGNALNARNITVSINGNTVVNGQTLDYFNASTFSYPFNISNIASGTANIQTTNSSGNGNDRMVIAYQEITYPRLFNFGNQSNFEFELPANNNGNYLEITNFNSSASIPVLYDLTNGTRYVAVVNGSQLRFALLPSTAKRNMVLVSQASSNIITVNTVASRVFTNFMSAALQGDYLILTSKMLHTSTASTNCIEKYKAYRNSSIGGGFNVKIVDAEDLYDQYSYGIEKHSAAIRNYLRHARNTFTTPIKFVLLIGRGTMYQEVIRYSAMPYHETLNMLPTFGWPASDNLLTADPGSSLQTTPIGRLGAINAQEVDIYLDKLKEYEQKQADMNFTIANKAWMKNGSFVTGSSEPFLQTILDQYNTEFKNSFWQDTFIGGRGNLFTKTAAGGVVPLTNSFMEQLWNEGKSVLEYFGHSSATALEFNLDDPYAYTNQGKYPMMVINGCNAGNYFVYNPFRITTNNNQTLSEKFVFAPNRGSIGFIASTSFGVVNYLYYWNRPFFNNASVSMYGKPVGEIMKSASQAMIALTGPVDFYSRMHSEQTLLQGDPAVRLNVSYPKPDYVVEDQTVKINPTFISIVEPNFKVKMMYMNLGKAINDSISIRIQRQYPAGNTETIETRRVKACYYADSLEFTVPIVPLRDKGLNKIIICLDAANEIDEMSETNNCITKDVFIFEDEAKPVHPYNYAIVNTLPVRLVGSTANPLSLNRTYNMEIDTTEKFNSPAKQSQSLTQVGGILEFAPISTLIPNTTYYWRVSVAGTNPVRWNMSSFTYLPTETLGFNQGHYFQHKYSTYQNINLDSSSRKFLFDSVGVNITVRSGVWPLGCYEEGQYIVSINQDPYIRGICMANGITFNIFDKLTGKPWKNNPIGVPGLYNSEAVCFFGREYDFNFNINSPVTRKHAMDFLDQIPNGNFVIVRNQSLEPWWFGTPQDDFISTWQTDQTLYGTGNSLYHKLYNLGCTKIDSFYKQRAYIFTFVKGQNNLIPPRQVVSEGTLDRISLATDFKIPDSVGYITSPAFGPAKSWTEVHWRGASLESPTFDDAKVTLLGIRQNGVQDSLTTLNMSQQDFNISNYNANLYPYMKLRMYNKDTSKATPWQLNYWRINYVPIPEGSVAPNISFNVKDTLEVGEPLNVQMAFKNISFAAFDSLKVKMVVLDRNGLSTTYVLPKQKPLGINEVLNINYTIPTANYAGINSLLIDVNPDNDQPEQYHFNNFIYKNFFVRPDNTNPLLDVTFDGVHILNKDIVSSNPNIIIKLKDENRFQALDDTSALKVQIRYPGNGTNLIRTYNWNTDTLRFIPATLVNGDNTATAELKPKNLPDGEYELIVSGKDKNGNKTGDIEYKILFTVINKPMISNLLNYPNPFTTSTAFVFYITGKEVPQNIKIEIMTVTGKIVREITKAELGPLRVGRNITDFKWDGTDQFGSKLANGVYLYRVVTNLNGQSLEKFKVNGDDKTDQFFNKGYGKMVLIR